VLWIQEHVTSDKRVAVLTDPLSIVSRLEMNMMRSAWWDSIKYVKSYSIFVYVPGYSSITYNEKADRVTGEATVFVDLVHEPGDVRRWRPDSTNRITPYSRSRGPCNDC
jgi:hypothetical protein